MSASIISQVAVTLSGGSASLTLPAGCTAVYVSWDYFNVTAAKGLTSATLNGSSPNQTHQIQTANSDQCAAGVAAWYSIPVGARTLVMTFDAATTEGPNIIATYVQNGDVTAYRDVKSAHGSSSTALTVTVTTQSGDLVIKHDQRNDAVATPPTLSVGWTDGVTQDLNQEHSRTSSIIATTTTQVANSEDENYSTLVAWSIPPLGLTNVTAAPTGVASTSAAGTVTPIARPAPPYTITTVTG